MQKQIVKISEKIGNECCLFLCSKRQNKISQNIFAFYGKFSKILFEDQESELNLEKLEKNKN